MHLSFSSFIYNLLRLRPVFLFYIVYSEVLKLKALKLYLVVKINEGIYWADHVIPQLFTKNYHSIP